MPSVSPYCDKAYTLRRLIMLMRRIHISRIWMRTRWEMTHISDEQTYYDHRYHFTIYQKKIKYRYTYQKAMDGIHQK